MPEVEAQSQHHRITTHQVTNAVNIVQQEWFKVSSTKQSNPLDVEDYLDAIEDTSRDLLDREAIQSN